MAPVPQTDDERKQDAIANGAANSWMIASIVLMLLAVLVVVLVWKGFFAGIGSKGRKFRRADPVEQARLQRQQQKAQVTAAKLARFEQVATDKQEALLTKARAAQHAAKQEMLAIKAQQDLDRAASDQRFAAQVQAGAEDLASSRAGKRAFNDLEPSIQNALSGLANTYETAKASRTITTGSVTGRPNDAMKAATSRAWQLAGKTGVDFVKGA